MTSLSNSMRIALCVIVIDALTELDVLAGARRGWLLYAFCS
jgi:hypothetical protein